jgi:hypothetical protein
MEEPITPAPITTICTASKLPFNWQKSIIACWNKY